MSLPIRNCRLCEIEFTPKVDTIFCINCFDDPSSYQHYCYAVEKLAKTLEVDVTLLSDDDIKNMRPLNQNEIDTIKDKIY